MGMKGLQGTLDELGTPLSEVTFVVVDLETTGGSPSGAHITEVGAVKIRGGEVLGEFQTLVNPAEPIPAFISVLTGITNSMVADSPRINSVFPAFLEFAGDSVLVAHNAPFDISFLKAAAAITGHSWPSFDVVDTAHLARQLVSKDEAANRKLGTLARLFGAATTPDHRALHDARATVDVLHGLLSRAGGLGVVTLEELRTFSSRVSSAQRRKRHLAEGLPSAPGVYLFKDCQGHVLYVGTSQDIRRRVRTYFTASEQRTRMAEMVGVAASVTSVVCETTLEAQVRELRLIAQYKPRYNRRSKNPERAPWVKLTIEPFPRLSIVRAVIADGARYFGPFSSRLGAETAIAAVHEVLPLRQCTKRLAANGGSGGCALAEMGRCGGPCMGNQSVQDYAVIVEQAAQMIAGDSREVVGALCQRMSGLAGQERYEDAGAVRDRLLQLVRAPAPPPALAPLANSDGTARAAGRGHPGRREQEGGGGGGRVVRGPGGGGLRGGGETGGVVGRDAGRVRRVPGRRERDRGRARHALQGPARRLQGAARDPLRADPEDLDRQGAEVRAARSRVGRPRGAHQLTWPGAAPHHPRPEPGLQCT